MKLNSAIAWRGLSLLDGKTPIVVLFTGLNGGSANRKTGKAVQAHILVDGMMPAEAAKTGAAKAICGDCPRQRNETRGTTCYVSLARGYPRIGEVLTEGRYRDLTTGELLDAIGGRFVRIGAYGDPAAVPEAFWRIVLENASGWTAYTHQWRSRPGLRQWAMASVESEAEKTEATMAGWRTFRIRRVTDDHCMHDEIVCPAAVEAGKRTTCENCRLCSGRSSPAKNIAIIDHSVAAQWKRGIGPRRNSLTVLQ
jgi:hypothetical protein